MDTAISQFASLARDDAPALTHADAAVVSQAFDRGPRALPTRVGDCPAFFHPADGDVAVLFCNAWGYEELCMRRSLGALAEGMAALGYPTLRIDFPGVGGSLAVSPPTIDGWIEHLRAAAAQLRVMSGAQRLVLAGAGLGALIAAEAVRRGFDCLGLAFVAPPSSGRRYVRETQAWAALLAREGDGAAFANEGDLTIAGFRLPGAFKAEIQALKGVSALAPHMFAILLRRQGVETAEANAQIDEISFEGLDDLIAGPTQAVLPRRDFEAFLGALRHRVPVGVSQGARATAPEAVLAGPVFCETALRFGPDDRLFGVWNAPTQPRAGNPCVVILNTGRNAHNGWRGMMADLARDLAGAGVASLRFDLGGMGESVADPQAPEEIIYSDFPIVYAQAALSLAQARGAGPIIVLGVCSGAYLAMRLALADQRVAGLASVNLYRLVWDDAETVEEAIRYANRPLRAAAKRLMSRSRLRELFVRRADALALASHSLRRVVRRLSIRFAPFVGGLSPRAHLYKSAISNLGALKARRVPVLLGYSWGDDGLTEMQDYFGGACQRLAPFTNVSFDIIGDCDHNLTTPKAISWLRRHLDQMIDQALKNSSERLST
jgi:pimeloyl-ACP methyl ester carboxylesterase